MSTPSVRARRTALLALTLLLAVAAASDSSSTGSAPVSSATPCEICRDTGDCSKAYDNGEGKFCGAYRPPRYYGDGLACCCAKSDTCPSSSYGCYCETPENWTWIMIGGFGAALVLALGITTRGRWMRRRRHGDVVYAESTVPCAQQVVYTQGPYVQQGYPQQGAFVQGSFPQQGYAPGFAPPGYTQGNHGV